jgi:chromosomal replication initiator protein
MAFPDRRTKTMPTPWDQFLTHLRGCPGVSRQAMETWIEPLVFLREDAQGVHLRAPDELFANWVKDHFLDLLGREWDCAHGRQCAFHVLVDDSPAPVKVSLRAAERPDLNPNFTFERFVEGKSNKQAYTAARSVADKPLSFNPLYIWGGIGIGKTHLLQAIGHELVRTKPQSRVRYISGERYVNDWIAALQRRSLEDFRNQFRRDCDVLLIDDIQFIGDKDKSQEEFFHTFNDLYNSGRQIVISGNMRPADAQGISEKLRSRLQWNLVVEIEPPELPLRVAILKDKANRMNLALSDEVAAFIAERVATNVRHLESTLAKLLFLARFNAESPSLDLAQRVLLDLFPRAKAEEAQVTPDMVVRAVTKVFGVTAALLKSKSRERRIVEARQVALFLSRKHTDLSAPALAEHFGMGSHASVLNAVQKIQQEVQAYANLKRQVAEVEALLEASRRGE